MKAIAISGLLALVLGLGITYNHRIETKNSLQPIVAADTVGETTTETRVVGATNVAVAANDSEVQPVADDAAEAQANALGLSFKNSVRVSVK